MLFLIQIYGKTWYYFTDYLCILCVIEKKIVVSKLNIILYNIFKFTEKSGIIWQIINAFYELLEKKLSIVVSKLNNIILYNIFSISI